MNSLVKEITKYLLPEQEKKQITALYAGGFKPPTSGHFEVVREALKQNPEIDEFIIFIGSKERDGVSQSESLLIWEIYNNYLPFKVKLEPTSLAPIKAIYDFAKNHPTREVLWVLGAREGNEEDFKDINSRTKSITNYPNIEVRTIITKGGVSGTAARNAAKVSFEKFEKFIPDQLTDEEKQEVYQLVSGKIQEEINLDKYNLALSQTEKEALNLVHKNWNKFGGKECNNGFCDIFASKLNKLLPGSIIISTEDSIPNIGTFGHVWVKYKDKYYDAETQKGVEDWKLLPWVQDFKTKTGEYPKIEVLKEQLNENASYSNHIDYKQKIKELTQHMLNQGMNIVPLPKVIFKHSDKENAKQFLGKTAYYNPETMEVVLYTEGRHPKDIVRSFSHEMIHHIQNLENRLGNIATTNTQEDDNLNDIEAEANLKGTMTFRNWTDSLNEAIVGDKIECDNCGWSWNIKDGGDDLYTCHKCGHNNSLKLTREIFFEEEDKLMVEVVNPDGEIFEYKESNIKGLFVYRDSYNNLYFARIFFNPIEDNPHFEFKTGWFEDNNISKPKYNPHLPPNTTGMDNLKRRNTVGKIYRDEILPFFKQNQNISNKLHINPISHSRHIFSQRLVKNHTPKDFNIEEIGETLIIFLPQNENKNKDPFGLNAYAMELGRLREEKTEYTIYCDLDGVLVDFDRGYEELTGITTQQADTKGVEAFWAPLTTVGAKFWITLKWMPDGKQLWNYIEKYKPKLLSAPSREESSKLGKRVWVKRELPNVTLILRSAERKKEFANPNSILIDDREKNIKQWEDEGGIGIFHTNTSNTIKQLKELGF
jgi:hypothetical protein